MNMLDLVKDKITGFEGYVTARCEYLDGTTHVRIEGVVSSDTEQPRESWFHTRRLEVVRPAAVTV